MRLIRLPLILAVPVFTACSGDRAPAKPLPPVGFALHEVTLQQAARERQWDGVVDAVDKATLSAQTGGRVIELPFDVNDYVKAGDVIARFTDVSQQSGRRQADAALRAAEANAREAKLAFDRARDMIDRNLIAQAAFDQAQARHDAAVASLDAARAVVRDAGEQVDYTVIRAPYSGILTERHVDVGETVTPGQPLVSGLSLARLRVEVDIPQGDLAAIREHDHAAVQLEDGRRIDATDLIVFPYADPKTHTFRARLELPQAETGLHPGMTVKAVFSIGVADRVLIPGSTLVRRGEVTAVYVVDPEQRVALRQIRIGQTFGDQVDVLAGLVPNELIAADPLSALAHITGQKEAQQ